MARKLDRFDVSVVHPYEMGELMEGSRLGRLMLGRVYNEISGRNWFVRSVVKAEIAAECAKLIVSKKCQEIILSSPSPSSSTTSQPSPSPLNPTLTTLLNLLLGPPSTKETLLLWKVLTLHSQLLYGVSL